MIAGKFKESLKKMEIIGTYKKELLFSADIFGYEKWVNYSDYRIIIPGELDLPEYVFVDDIQIGNYGFMYSEGEDGYDHNLITSQDNSKFKIESIRVNSYTSKIDFMCSISGEPAIISDIADGFKLYIELNVTGCLKETLFWEQSFFISYLMAKNNNILGSFMHLFIAFEGLLRYHTNITEGSIHKVYKKYTNENLPDYLNAYRIIRNQIMHGNENIASNLEVTDLEILINTIDKLKINDHLILLDKDEYTEVIRKGIQEADRLKKDKQK